MTGEMNGGVSSTSTVAAASGGGAAAAASSSSSSSSSQGAKPPAGDWLAVYDHHLLEEGYKRHLQRHANKYGYESGLGGRV